MSAERRPLPDWAQEQREADFAWIRENLPIFTIASQVAYEGSGRGALVVDTTVQPVPGIGHPFAYFTETQIAEHGDEDTQRMVEDYDPEQEFIIVLLKEEGRSSTYRVQPQEPPGGA